MPFFLEMLLSPENLVNSSILVIMLFSAFIFCPYVCNYCVISIYFIQVM